MISESAFWAVDRCEGAADVVVSFSALNTRPGSFMLRHLLASFPAQRVYLNCPGNQWYLDGVPGLGDSPEATADSLSALIDSLRGPGGRVLFFGGSMGGYGAVEYGSRCGADLVLATGVETILNIPTGASAPHLKGRMPQTPLVDLLAASQVKTILIYGEESASDMMCAIAAAQALKAGSELVTVPHRDHKIPPWLEQKYGFFPLFSGLLRGESLPLAPADRGDLADNPDLVRAIFVASLRTNGLAADGSDPAPLLSAALADASLSPGQRSAAAVALVRLWLHEGRPWRAFEAAEAGLALRPDGTLLNGLAARAALAIDRPVKARAYAATAMRLGRQDLLIKDDTALLWQIQLCHDIGEIGPGLRLAQRYMPPNPNPRLWKLYEALLTRHLEQVRQDPAAARAALAAMQDVQAP